MTKMESNAHDKEGSSMLLTQLPVCLLLDHVMPFVDDRTTWNHFSMACHYIRRNSKKSGRRLPWPHCLSSRNHLVSRMISCLVFSPNGRYVACGSLSQVDVWDLQSGHLVQY
jgi:WD40 repeat protein